LKQENGTMRLGKKIAPLVAAFGVLLAPGLATDVAAQDAAVAGEAYGTWVESDGATQDKTPHAWLETGSVMDEADAPSTSLPGVVAAENLFSTTTGAGSDAGSTAESSSTLERVEILGGVITAESVVAISSSWMTPEGAGTSAGGSSFSNLVVDGQAIDADVAPNTAIEVPGVGTVILNEQIIESDADGVSLTVNMIHVVLKDALTGAETGEIVVGSASSAVAN
jgi:hypothetical protein